MDIQKRLKRVSLRTRETLKRLRSAGVGQWRLVWVSGARQWVLVGSSKAMYVVCLAVFEIRPRHVLLIISNSRVYT